MARNYRHTLFDDAVKAEQERHGSRASYAKLDAGADGSPDALTAKEIAFIAGRDSFYIASVNPEGWPYMQHRGGPAGFLRHIEGNRIGFADYRGNRHFNTLGNILTNPRAGLLFIDSETGDLFQLSGEAAIDIDALAASQRIGAERLWTFRPRRIVRRKSGSPLRWIAQENCHSHSSLATLPDHDPMQPKG